MKEKTVAQFTRGSILILPLIFSLPTLAQSGTTVSHTPWKMIKGIGLIKIKKTEGMVSRTQIDSLKGKSSADIATALAPYFNGANIPTDGDHWTPVNVTTMNDKQYFFHQPNAGITDCASLESVQYTYFETFINIPENYDLKQFSITFDNTDMDDASRITISNNVHKDTVVPGSYVPLRATATSDLVKYIVPGQNRIVVTNLDNCAHITVPKINVNLNGAVIEKVSASSCEANEVARWSFENNANDVSGNERHGTTKDNATYTAGYSGQGISLDGKSDSIVLNKKIPAHIFSTGDYTISGAFKSTASGDIVSIVDDSNKHGILIELAQNGHLRFLHRLPFSSNPNIGKNIFSKKDLKLNDGKFHTFSAITHAGKLELIVDGDSQGTAEVESTFNSDLNFIMGKLLPTSNQRNFKGVLDEIRIHNGAVRCELSRDDEVVLNKIPETSNMMTAAVSGKIVPSDKAFYFLHQGSKAKIVQTETPTKLKLVRNGEKVSFLDADNSSEWVSVTDTEDSNCHSHILTFTTNPNKKAEFYVRSPQMEECGDGSSEFCVKPEDLFASYEYVTEPGHFMRHCGYVIGLQAPTNKNNTEIGDMTWRMQQSK